MRVYVGCAVIFAFIAFQVCSAFNLPSTPFAHNLLGRRLVAAKCKGSSRLGVLKMTESPPSGETEQAIRRKFIINRRDAGKWIAGAVAAAFVPVLASPVHAADDFQALIMETRPTPPSNNPYEALEPFGESFRGKKGPNLQLPQQLSEDDEAPAAMSQAKKPARNSDFFESLSPFDMAASFLWGSALYYGIWFDINAKTNAIQSASGDEGDVRPSDWIKLKLGQTLGMGQQTWSDDWKPPASLQAFTVALFAMLGTAVERGVDVALGDSFALMSGMTAAIWAGVYELGRTQQRGYRLTREEQEQQDQLNKDFSVFVADMIVVKPTARMHMTEFVSAFRQYNSRYRNTEQISDSKLEGLFKTYARKAVGTRGKAGFYKGIGIKPSTSAFGGENAAMRREKEALAFRDAAKEEAAAAAARSLELAARSGQSNQGQTSNTDQNDSQETAPPQASTTSSSLSPEMNEEQVVKLAEDSITNNARVKPRSQEV